MKQVLLLHTSPNNLPKNLLCLLRIPCQYHIHWFYIYVCSFILSSVWLFCWILCKENEKKKKIVTALYVWFTCVSRMAVGGCCACRILYYTWYIRYDGGDPLIPQVTNTMVFGKNIFLAETIALGEKNMKYIFE